MFDSSNLAPNTETPDKDADQVFWKLRHLDKLFVRGQHNLLSQDSPKLRPWNALYSSSSQFGLGGAQTALIKSFTTLPAGLFISTRGNSLLLAFSEDSLQQFDSSQEFVWQIVGTSRASVFSFYRSTHS